MSEAQATEEKVAETKASSKLDPESLAIRVQPQRAIRFRRGIIIGVAALGSVSLMAVAWVALEPPVFQTVATGTDLSEPAAKPAGDALANLPANYANIPRLGPPLPGDLGRPILAHQRAIENAGTDNSQQQVASAAANIAQQRAEELKAARRSGLLAQVSGRSGGIDMPDTLAAGAEAPPQTAAARLSLDPEHDPGGQQRKADFIASRDPGGDINPHSIAKPASPYMLLAGSVIAASLITGLNSDLPGLVTAQVSQHVYDSATGRILLIPQGARLIGSYDSVVAFGQKRALVIWQRIILPDGSSLRIDNVPTTDPSGYAGLADKVDFHSWALLKGVALATLLGVGTELTVTGESDLVQAIRQSTQQNMARAGDQLTSRNLNIPPSITIRPGAPVRLVVHKDLVLAPWRGNGG